MAKDQTEVGITGKPVPKPRTAKQQYELEKKKRLKTDQSTGKSNPEYDDLTYKQQVAHVKGKEKANKQKRR